MTESNTITLPVSGATVEFIPFVTGGILLDISKQKDINKYLMDTMIVKVTHKPAAEGEAGLIVTDVYEESRKMHGRDFKAIDKKLQDMLLEAQPPEEEQKK